MQAWLLLGFAVLTIAQDSIAPHQLSREELLARRDEILRRAARPRPGQTQFSRPVVLATGPNQSTPKRIKLSGVRPRQSVLAARRRRLGQPSANIKPNNFPPSIPDRPPSPFATTPMPGFPPALAPQAVIKPPVQQVPSISAPLPQQPQLTPDQIARIRQIPNIGPILKRTAGLLGFPPGTAIGDAIPSDTKPLTDLLALPPQPSAGQIAPNFFQGGGPVDAFPSAAGLGLAGIPGGVGGIGGVPAPAGLPLPAQSQAISPLINIFRSISQKAGLDRFFQANPGGISVPGLDALVSSRSPPVPGIPRIPGLPLLPGGIPRDANGQVDVLRLATLIGRRFTAGRSISDYFPPDRIQSFADNVTESLLPDTANVELEKMMGRWFEGINTPDASNEKCIVHHFGGLSSTGQGDRNVKTFSALKIFREGSEFGQVRYSIGFAFRGGHRKGMLQFHYSGSEGSEPQPFWVYKLGPEVEDALGQLQYEYAVVSNWIKYPFTVLVRDPDTFKEKYEVEVLRWLEENNFVNSFTTAFNLVQPTAYTECQYSKSTYKVLG